MTNEEKYQKSLEILERKKKREQEKKKKEREKKRVQGFRRYVARKQRERKKEEEKKRRLKEKEKEKKEKLKLLPKKKKPGRPKKRGPKKKRQYKAKTSQIKKVRPTYDYKVVLCENGRQIAYFNAFMKVDDAYECAKSELDKSKLVIFPRRVLAGGESVINEILILEKDRIGDKKDPILRNEFGKLVEQKTNRSDWKVFDKFRINLEEDFWIYGFDPRHERKTAQWIYDNHISNGFIDEYDIKRVMIYLNKLIIKNDSGIELIVFCKTMSEAIRLYNKMEELTKKDKNRKAYFIGSLSELSDMRRKLENELIELTGWDKTQIRRRKTKY